MTDGDVVVMQLHDWGRPNYRFKEGEIYTGELRNGRRHGRGTFDVNGCVAVGQFEEGLLQGIGMETHADGAVYKGAFVDGRYNGHGLFTYPHGGTYEGELKDGEIHGTGTRVYVTNKGTPKGDYRGQWVMGRRHGRGRRMYADGSMYLGQWKEDLKSGHGDFRHISGERYIAEWHDNQPVHGVKWSADGRTAWRLHGGYVCEELSRDEVANLTYPGP